jgi:hypothetical protein
MELHYFRQKLHTYSPKDRDYRYLEENNHMIYPNNNIDVSISWLTLEDLKSEI